MAAVRVTPDNAGKRKEYAVQTNGNKIMTLETGNTETQPREAKKRAFFTRFEGENVDWKER